MRWSSTFTCSRLGRTINASVNEIMINGKLTMNMAGQSHEAIKKPPMDGPNAADVVEKMDKTARACACFFVMLVRTIAIPLGNSVELPIACSARHPNRKGEFGENGASTLDSATMASPARNRRFGPNMSLNFAITG